MDEPDDLKELQEKIEAIKAEHNAYYLETLQVNQEEEKIKQEEQAAYKAYQAIVAKKREELAKLRAANREKQEKATKLRWEHERLQRELELKKQQIEEEKRKAVIAEKYTALHESWNKLTLRAQWREWAKDHQIQAGHFITENRKVILADPMGLGKTLSSIITCDMAEAATREASKDWPFLGEEKFKQVYNPETGQYDNKPVIVNGIERPVGKRILYFCPSSLIRNVLSEFREWSRHRSVTHVGGMTKAEREAAFQFGLKNAPEFVVICNYEAWRRDSRLLDQFIELDPDTVILDEAHILKDPKTSAHKGIKRILEEAGPEYIVPMTGTPILNRPQELFWLLTLVNPQEFYNEKDFLWSYCEQDEMGRWRFQPGGIERVGRKIKKNFLRRTKEQAGIILPENSIIFHELEVDKERYPDQDKVRQQMKQYATIMVDEQKGQAVTAAAAIAVYTRLRQIETWPAAITIKDKVTGEVKFSVDVEESQKIDYIISKEPDEYGDFTGLIPEAIEDERMVLFSQFTGPLFEIRDRVIKAGYRPVILHGKTSDQDREIINKDFDRKYTKREDAKWDIVLCNYKVGGVGLNFTAATQTIILDEEWNPGKRDQAYGRTSRMGQTEQTTVHVIRNKHTVDDWLGGIMDMKEGMVEGFNATMTELPSLEDFLNDSGLA